MATHDYIISNQTFPSTRSDINAVLSAIVSNNSSATEPTTTYAYMWWYDTTTTTLKFRNRDNDAWVGFASFDMDNDTVNFLDSTVTITGLATSATGTTFTLSDTDNKSSVDFIIDNEKKLILREATGNGTNAITFKAPSSLSQDYNFTLPSNYGTADQVLKTNGSGGLTWGAGGVTRPTISTTSLTGSPSTSETYTITGTGFVSVPIVEFISTTGAITRASAVSFSSSVSIDATVTLSNGTYYVRVENNDGGAVRTTNAILTVSEAPTWSTASGSIGTVSAGSTVSLSVSGSSDSTVAYSETTSVLTSNTDTPATTMNLSLNSLTGAITGTAPSPTGDTTYTFTLRLTDAESQTADRSFSITVSVGINNAGQFN
jgi:trimeric autotransporter adhesin